MIQEDFSDFASNFSSRLKKIRLDAGLNQTDFARKIGFSSHVSISKFELGLAFPSTDVLWKIASEFQVDLHWLITGNAAPESSLEHKMFIEFTELLCRYINSEVSRLLDLRDMLEGLLVDVKGKGQDGSEIESQIKSIQYNLNRVLGDIKRVDEWTKGFV